MFLFAMDILLLTQVIHGIRTGDKKLVVIAALGANNIALLLGAVLSYICFVD